MGPRSGHPDRRTFNLNAALESAFQESRLACSPTRPLGRGSKSGPNAPQIITSHGQAAGNLRKPNQAPLWARLAPGGNQLTIGIKCRCFWALPARNGAISNCKLRRAIEMHQDILALRSPLPLKCFRISWLSAPCALCAVSCVLCPGLCVLRAVCCVLSGQWAVGCGL